MQILVFIIYIAIALILFYCIFFRKNYKSGFPTFKTPPMPEIKIEKDSETKELEVRKIESDNQLKIAIIDLLKTHYKITYEDNLGLNTSIEDAQSLPTFNESFLKSFKELYTSINKA